MATVKEIVSNIERGIFHPYYLLMGEEPYFSDLIIDKILSCSLTEEEKGFNLSVLYGSDLNSVKIIEYARRFPMMASRQVVVVKEAQTLKDLDLLEKYFHNTLSTTVLVISLTNKSIDKRTKLYKAAVGGKGVVFESVKVKENQLALWIEEYVNDKGAEIDPEAAVLLAEYSGNELRKLAQEVDKLLMALTEGSKRIAISDVEENVGITREFSAFELTKALSMGDVDKVFRIGFHFAANQKQYPIYMTLAVLFMHFSRILKYNALKDSGRAVSSGDFAKTLGINPYFLREYASASTLYPVDRCMRIIALIRGCDSMAKSNDRGEATDGELLQELLIKMVS